MLELLASVITDVIQLMSPSTYSSSSSGSSTESSSFEPKKVVDPMSFERHVYFKNKVAVVLIPSVNEYIEAGCDLWWSRDDLKAIRSNFQVELFNEMETDPSIQNISEAIKKLCKSTGSGLEVVTPVESRENKLPPTSLLVSPNHSHAFIWEQHQDTRCGCVSPTEPMVNCDIECLTDDWDRHCESCASSHFCPRSTCR